MNTELTPKPERKLWHDGPNYTADAVVIQPDEQKILLIQRSDTGQWALPGGFIDENETQHDAAKREALEETGAALTTDGALIYQGLVDDPRNSETAWIETSAYLFLTPEVFSVTGSDDALAAEWKSLHALPELYGSHKAIVEKAFEYLEG